MKILIVSEMSVPYAVGGGETERGAAARELPRQENEVLAHPSPIAINGRFLAQRTTGVQRFAREVTRMLDAHAPWPAEILVPSDVPIEWHGDLAVAGGMPLRRFRLRRVGRLTGHAWEQFELPWATRGRFLLNLCNTAPLAVGRQAVVMHDAGVYDIPEAYGLAFRSWYRLLFGWHARRATALATVSRFSADRLHAHAVPADQRIHVLGNGGEHILRAAPDASVCARFGLPPGRFVLTVGSLAAHKNLAVVLEARRILGTACSPIAIVGSADTRVVRAADVASEAGIVRVGHVTDAELRGLFEAALCLVYPSLYEGFGVPPLEAMLCGCPVVASDIPAVREVCGDAATYFDAASATALAERLIAVERDPAIRSSLVDRGQRCAAAWTWAAVSSRVVDMVAATSSGSVG